MTSRGKSTLRKRDGLPASPMCYARPCQASYAHPALQRIDELRVSMNMRTEEFSKTLGYSKNWYQTTMCDGHWSRILTRVDAMLSHFGLRLTVEEIPDE